MKRTNPFAFRSGPVALWTSVLYLSLIISLVYIHETVPAPPAENKLPEGLNLTEAWGDLQAITRAFHPYNSHENDHVRDYLIARSKEILETNGVEYTVDTSGGVIWSNFAQSSADTPDISTSESPAKPRGVTLFDDQISNVTFTDGGIQSSGLLPLKVQYFEGNNFYAYIHGREDPEGNWWTSDAAFDAFRGKGGVLVNCHFDSVATAYGATDDGVSCVSLLQLLKHFTLPENQPKHGIVLLFNNAEEDGLFGARAFGYSPLLKFCHTFVNLEGAGAGGRAMLFRTTDLEAAQAYGKSPYPFGSVVAANAFERGFIKSGTDYEVFYDSFGQRGLDIAFYAPRSRYHTEDDDARHTSTRSIWHMVSAALASTKELSEITGSVFSGDRSDGRKDLVQNGRQTSGVWFDWFGSGWSAFPLRGLFAWTLTLLITTPLVLLVVSLLLFNQDKYYFFAQDIKGEPGEDPIRFGGWRGFFRFPLALGASGAVTVASVLVVAKVNPMIIYSSGYAVWAMALSLFYVSYWLLMRGASYVRASALHRGYVLMWLFVITWGIQVFIAVAEDRMGIAAFYFMAFFHTGVFLALLVSLVEMFALPSKTEFARRLREADIPRSPFLDAEPDYHNNNIDDGNDADIEDATEETPLRSGEDNYGSTEATAGAAADGDNTTTTFASTYRRAVRDGIAEVAADIKSYSPFEGEQSWSGRLPSWTWIVQLLLLGPIHIILVGTTALVQTAAMAQTGTDGNNISTPLVAIASLTIILLLPLTPFMHRVRHSIPLLLFLVFVGTFIYNLAAFPFSVNYRFKYYFQQTIDLDTKSNTVSLYGLQEFLHPVIASLPAAAGQTPECGISTRSGYCKYNATSAPPNVVDGVKVEDLITAEYTKEADGKSIRITIDAVDTRICYVDFSKPVYGFQVEGGAPRDRRVGRDPRQGMVGAQLWRRKWDGPWTAIVDIVGPATTTTNTASEDPLRIMIRCAWSDVNEPSKIPAFGELQRYAPEWTVPTKYNVGLVEIHKSLTIS